MERDTDYKALTFKTIEKAINLYRIFYSSHLSSLICSLKGVHLGKKVIFNGIIRIKRAPYSRIIIGNSCRFNSSRNSIKEGLTRPCSLITLSENASIILGEKTGASGANIVATSSIKIGNNVLIGAHSTITDSDMHGSDPSLRKSNSYSKPIVIEDNVFIGYNCFILKGVHIGKNTVIGANSVVVSSIPENSIALGNPCKVLIKRNWG